MIPYLPHSDEDREEMLDAIGVDTVARLFEDIPEDILLTRDLALKPHLSEFEVLRKLQELAGRNRSGVSFLGGGIYDHIIPSVVPFVTSRTEFLSAYTPYQAEMSQGILQAIFEFQTLMCELTGMDVSNASLYDGATAAAEACAMAINSVRGADTILYSSTVNPMTLAVLETFFSKVDVTLRPVEASGGCLKMSDLAPALKKGIAGVLVQSPNRYGCIEDYTNFADVIHDTGAKILQSANPLSLGLLKSPGEWGVDIAVGDGQPLGLAPNFGGPCLGYICATSGMMRKMPGRIVGESLDADGKRGYVLTLQAREQHIKRERATSNICTNQAIAALGVAAYLGAVGPEGLRDAATQSHDKAAYLMEKLASETAAEPVFAAPFFNEFAITLPVPAQQVIDSMIEDRFFAGVPLSGAFGGTKNQLLVAVTEKRTRDELDEYVRLIGRAC